MYKAIAMSKLSMLIQLHAQGRSKLFISRYLDYSLSMRIKFSISLEFNVYIC